MKNKRKVKIITTIGPASESPLKLKRLIQAGADIFRFNLKHNTISWHNKIIDRARKIAEQQNKQIKILIDLPSYSFKPGIDLVLSKEPEYIALSYIKKVDEIINFRQTSNKFKLSSSIIAKIETKEALNNFTLILNKADALMVARGDLGKSIPIEKVPFVQKEIVSACRKNKKTVIIATEMLLSMISSKEPTRAEVSDVANAVLDRSNAVMLSEETAIGKHPIEAVKIMNKIIYEAENWQKMGHLNIVSKYKNFKFGL